MKNQVFTNGQTRMWRLYYGKNIFRFQSTFDLAIKRMRQRQGFNLSGWQTNGLMRLFDAELYDQKSAKRALEGLSKGDPY